MMTVGGIGVLIIAALFFVVTMAVAVGPLLVCRIFANAGRDECRPQPRGGSLASGVLTFCGVVIGLGIGVFVLYFTLHSSSDRSAATVVYEDTSAVAVGPMPAVVIEGQSEFLPVPIDPYSQMPVEFVDQSLFAPPPPPAPPYPAQPDFGAASPVFTRSHLEIGSIVLMALVLLVTTVAVLGSQTIRTGLARVAPVALAIVLLGGLFFWTSPQRSGPYAERHADISMHGVTQLSPSTEVRRPLTTAVRHPAMEHSPEATVAVDEHSISAAHPAATESTSAEDSAKMTDPPVLAYVGVSADGVPHQALPKWTGQTDDAGPIRVIDSGLHATVQLAEEHSLKELKSLLQVEMAQRTPQAAGWQAPDEVVLNAGNILQRVVERSQIQVGENTIPMYEVYWQVELGHLEPLYRAWRPSVVQQRLIQLAGGIALLTLLLGSIAGVLRVDEQTHGRRRKSLAAGTLALLAVFGSWLALFVA